MKRIAIVACENSNTVCAGCACLNAFYAEITSYINKTSHIEGGGTTKS